MNYGPRERQRFRLAASAGHAFAGMPENAVEKAARFFEYRFHIHVGNVANQGAGGSVVRRVGRRTPLRFPVEDQRYAAVQLNTGCV